MLFCTVAIAILAFTVVMLVARIRKHSFRLDMQSKRLNGQQARLNAQGSIVVTHYDWLKNLDKLRERQDDRITELENTVRSLVGDEK